MELAWPTPLRDDRGRKAAVLAASAAFHTVVLGWLAAGVLGLGPRIACCEGDPLPRPLYLDIEPRPLLSGETARLRTRTTPPPPSSVATRPASPSAVQGLPPGVPASPSAAPASTPPVGPRPAAAVAPDAAPVDDRWRVESAPPTDARLARSMRLSAAGCRALDGRLTTEDQAVCDRRAGLAFASASAIAGTGDPARDARFAAQGAAALAAYDARRAPLKPNSRANPCPHASDIMGRCEVQIIVPIIPLLELVFPGLKEDE